jgi:hypothetical protein
VTPADSEISSNWLFNWAIGYATPYMVDSGKGNANLQSKGEAAMLRLPLAQS